MLDWIDPVILNFVYAASAGFVTIWFIERGWRSLNKMVNFNISDQLVRGNVAVGLTISGMFTGTGVPTGRVIGPGLS
jgi:hypothetical protein